MRTVKEVSELTGISVRTLHHYDAIDLLKPAKVTKAGYRLYDDAAMERLQTILLFRELEFPLKEIKEILDSPKFCFKDVIEQQIHLLELQKKHIDQLILLAHEMKDKGGYRIMQFEVFQNKEAEQYKKEAKEKWGGTVAYQEYEQRANSQNAESEKQSGMELMNLFAEIGSFKELAPEDKVVQEKVGAIQQFITDHYYTCTKDIFRGLGSMYVSDERFKKNIDKVGGEGTAEFVKRAIDVFCNR